MPLLFDSYVFGITLFKTYHQAKEMRELKQRSITELLLRDGTALYLFLLPLWYSQMIRGLLLFVRDTFKVMHISFQTTLIIWTEVLCSQSRPQILLLIWYALYICIGIVIQIDTLDFIKKSKSHCPHVHKYRLHVQCHRTLPRLCLCGRTV